MELELQGRDEPHETLKYPKHVQRGVVLGEKKRGPTLTMAGLQVTLSNCTIGAYPAKKAAWLG